MQIEHWFETHVFLTALGTLLLGGFLFGPLSGDLRAFYSKLPQGLRAARLAAASSHLRELQACQEEPFRAVTRTARLTLFLVSFLLFEDLVGVMVHYYRPLRADHSVMTLDHLHLHAQVETTFLVLFAFSFAVAAMFGSLMLRALTANLRSRIDRAKARVAKLAR